MIYEENKNKWNKYFHILRQVIQNKFLKKSAFI